MVVSEPLHVLPSNKMGKLKNDEKGKNWKMQKMSEKTNEEKRKEHQRGNGAQEQQQDTDPTHTHTHTYTGGTFHAYGIARTTRTRGEKLEKTVCKRAQLTPTRDAGRTRQTNKASHESMTSVDPIATRELPLHVSLPKSETLW